MIVSERKPLEKIAAMLDGHKKILIFGCGGCVTVCMAGGEKEVGILASQLRIKAKKEGQQIDIKEATIERQCDAEFFDKVSTQIEEADAILSLSCGAGVQFIAERFPTKVVYPGVDTKFIGVTVEHGSWSERCQACGDCILDKTGGICPIARCSKSLLNGPCGGSTDGKCEVDPENIECGWQLIYKRLQKLGRLDLMKEIIPARDWSTSRDGGPRRVVREDIKI